MKTTLGLGMRVSELYVQTVCVSLLVLALE